MSVISESYKRDVNIPLDTRISEVVSEESSKKNELQEKIKPEPLGKLVSLVPAFYKFF